MDRDVLPKWLERTIAIFNFMDQSITRTAGSSVPAPPSTRTLRDRTKLSHSNTESNVVDIEKKAPRKSNDGHATRKPRSSTGTATAGRKPRNSVEPVVTSQPEDSTTDSSSPAELSEHEPVALTQDRKPLPKVILKLGKRPEETDK